MRETVRFSPPPPKSEIKKFSCVLKILNEPKKNANKIFKNALNYNVKVGEKMVTKLSHFMKTTK